jgi:predicted Fe-Mo cluster-binding NifX family protein
MGFLATRTRNSVLFLFTFSFSFLFAHYPPACGGKPCPSRIHGKNDSPMLFAVVSKDGAAVDRHFGHTAAFYIYRYINGTLEFVERREVPQSCHGKESCGIGAGSAAEDHAETLNSIIETVAGYTGVIALRIGYEPPPPAR